MKILAIADEEDKFLWDFFDREYFKDIDLILSAGDLKQSYLEFLVTMTSCPVLYIHGNHDSRYQTNPPGGCTCIDGKLYNFNGLRILGLGGSMRYKPGPYMYRETKMTLRILKLLPALALRGGCDILLTHAPAFGLNDLEDLPHRGFECFNTLLDTYRPAYFIHGHVHRNYGARIPQMTKKGATIVVNAFEYCIFDY